MLYIATTIDMFADILTLLAKSIMASFVDSSEIGLLFLETLSHSIILYIYRQDLLHFWHVRECQQIFFRTDLWNYLQTHSCFFSQRIFHLQLIVLFDHNDYRNVMGL